MQFSFSIVILTLTAQLYARPQSEVWQSYKSLDKLWTDCTKSTAHGKITSIDIQPNPPKRGSKVSIIGNVTVDETVTSGSITAQVLISGFPYQQKFDLCDALGKVNHTCPVKPGPLVLSFDTKIPSEAPPGVYKGKAVANDQNNQEIFCINFALNLQ